MGTDFVVKISTLSKISPQHHQSIRREVASIVLHLVQPEPVSSLTPGTFSLDSRPCHVVRLPMATIITLGKKKEGRKKIDKSNNNNNTGS